MMDLPLEVEYRWSSRRKSIGLTITGDGKLVVAAPRGTPASKIAQAMAKHRPWIERKAAERQEAWARLQGGLAFFLGRPYRLTAAPRAREAVTLAGEEMQISPAGDDPSLWPSLKNWYRQQAQGLINERIRHYGARMGLRVSQAEMREWKRRWGECHPQGRLRFNWRLILLPLEVVDYVVVHELAHLLVSGHPAPFWRQVARILPDWKRRRQWLNRYGTPFLSWQPGLENLGGAGKPGPYCSA